MVSAASARKRSRLVRIALIVLTGSLTATAKVGCLPAADSGQGRAWTTLDSVELQHIQRGGAAGDGFHYSPDGRWVAFVVEASNVRSNALEATLKVYATSALKTFLTQGTVPTPVFAASMSKASGAPALGELTWLADGSALLFISRSNGLAKLVRWDANSGERVDLSSDGRSVIAFAPIDVRTVAAFLASPPQPPQVAPQVATGQPLQALIDDDLAQDVLQLMLPQQIALVDVFSGAVRITAARGLPVQGLAVSPDRRTLAYAESFAADWQNGCWTDAGVAPRKSAVAQLALLQLASGHISRPFQAPTGAALLADYTSGLITWSADSRHAIAHSTFSVDERCGGASKDTPHASSAFLFSPGSDQPPVKLYTFDTNMDGAMPYSLDRVLWSADAQQVTLRIVPVTYAPYFRAGAPAGRTATDLRFELKAGHWIAAGSTPVPLERTPAASSDIALALAQGYNTLPSVVVRSGKGRTRTLLDLAPRSSNVRLDPVREIQWTDKRGRVWSGLLGVADQGQARRRPLILQTHGFPKDAFFAEGPSTSAFPGRAALARGFAVLTIKEREDVISGPRPDEAPSMLESYRSAVEHLASLGLIDPNKVGAIGWSRTAYYVKYAITHQPALFSAAAVADGMDYGYWQRLAGNDFIDLSFGHQFDAAYGGSLTANKESWFAQAPELNAHKVTAPTRIEAYGKGSVIQEWGFFAAMRIAGLPVDLLTYANEDHSLVNPQERLASTGGTLEWMDFWLNGREDGDPSKNAQYQRWRQLRALREPRSN